jgi:hypothetical protein
VSYTDQVPHRDSLGNLTTVGDKLRALAAGAGTGGFYYLEKSADQNVTSSTTLVDDTELLFPIAANERWEFEFELGINGATGGDMRVALSVPSGATGTWSGMALNTSASGLGTAMVVAMRRTFTDADYIPCGTSGTTDALCGCVRLKGTVTNGSTAGNVRLRFAQDTSSATASTVRAKSFVDAIRTYPYQPAGANYGAMQLVASQTLGAAATSFTAITGLDLSADSTYIVRFGFKNATASQAAPSLFYNADTTAANYSRQRLSANGTAVAGSRSTSSAVVMLLEASSYVSGEIKIMKPSTGGLTRAMCRSNTTNATGVTYEDFNHVWTASTANVTSLQIVSDIATSLDTGSYVEVYRLSPVASQPIESLQYAVTDETTVVTTGTNKIRWRMPYAFRVSGVRASLNTAQSSGSVLTVDINEGGTSILSTKLTFDNTEKTTTTAATPAAISDTDLADDAEMSIDVDTVGAGDAAGLKVTLIGRRLA